MKKEKAYLIWLRTKNKIAGNDCSPEALRWLEAKIYFVEEVYFRICSFELLGFGSIRREINFFVH